jgi:molybdopterin-biosynthesis enzyme MoeA-like protein
VDAPPGFLFEERGKSLLLMPGVPLEMLPMLDQEIVPYLKKITRKK